MMLTALALSVLSLQEVLSESTGSQQIAAVSLPSGMALQSVGGAKEWRADLQTARAERSGISYTWVWDSSALLSSQLVRPDATSDIHASGTRIALLFLRKGHRDSKPVSVQSLNKSFRERVASEISRLLPVVGESFAQSEGFYVMRLDPRLVIEGESGETFEFALTPSGLPQKARSLKDSEKPDVRRVPVSLEQALAKQTLHLPSGRLPVKKAVEMLAPAIGNLTIDARVLDRDILMVNKKPETGIGAGEAARIIASSMGMYWREVGPDWHLACSPEHPITRSYELRREKNLKAAFELLTEMGAAGLLPEGVALEQMAEGFTQGQPTDKKALLALLIKLGDKARLLSKDPKSLQALLNGSKPLKVRFMVSGTLDFKDQRGGGTGFGFSAP